MSDVTLKPCECGNDEPYSDRHNFGAKQYFIECNLCWRSSATFPTEDEAIAAWNQRADAQGEPVVWMYTHPRSTSYWRTQPDQNHDATNGWTETPLYTHPPAQDVAALVEASIHMAASLAAAISLLKKGGKAAKRAAPSDRMFDQMIADYEAALDRARTALAKHERTPHE